MTTNRPTAVRYLVMVWYCALAALAYVHRNAVAVPAKEIEENLKLTREEMGIVMSVFFLGYSAAQIPGGWFAARWGSRLIAPALVLLWSISNGLMALAWGFSFLVGCRFLMGVAQAGIFPCAVQSFSRWFQPTQRNLPNGFLTAFMSVGGVLAGALTGLLLQFTDWRTLMILYAVPGLVCGLWFYFWFRERPEEHPSVNSEELALIREHVDADSAPLPIPKEPPWYTQFLSMDLLLVCMQQFCRAAAYIFYATWWPTFLREARELPLEEAAYLSTLPLAGVAVGAITGGFLSDWIYRRTGSMAWSRKGLAITSLIAAGLLMVLGFIAADVLFTIIFLTLSSFFAGVCGTASYTITIDLGGKQVATVFSVMNMSGNIGATLLPMVVGPIQVEHGWDSVLLLIAALYATAALCWAFVRTPRRPIASS